MSGQQFYEEGEAEEILRRALQQSHSGSIDRQRLVAMAGELGISEESLERAEAEMAREREANAAAISQRAERAEFRRYRKGAFWQDFSGYFTACLIATALWWFTSRGYFWPGWVMGVGGVAMLTQFFTDFIGFSERDFQRWKRKREKRDRKK